MTPNIKAIMFNAKSQRKPKTANVLAAENRDHWHPLTDRHHHHHHRHSSHPKMQVLRPGTYIISHLFSPCLSLLSHTDGVCAAVVQRVGLTPCLTNIISYDRPPMSRKSVANLLTFPLTLSDYHLHLKTLICSKSSHYDLEISYEFPTARSKVNLRS